MGNGYPVPVFGAKCGEEPAELAGTGFPAPAILVHSQSKRFAPLERIFRSLFHSAEGITMAFVKELSQSAKVTLRVQPTQVVCLYTVGDVGDGRKFFQLDSYGSEGRQLEGKMSQTLQFDEQRARSLWVLLGREFGFGNTGTG